MATSRETVHLVVCFPNLLHVPFEITSPRTDAYNCIAWAATGEQDRWWEPISDRYWPPGVRREYSVEAFLEAFRSLGYLEFPSGSAEMEDNFEKIALYALR